MEFNKQIKKAKEKQLESRITRDVVFMLLGLTFLGISIFSTIINKKNVINKNNKTTTTVINKNIKKK